MFEKAPRSLNPNIKKILIRFQHDEQNKTK